MKQKAAEVVDILSGRGRRIDRSVVLEALAAVIVFGLMFIALVNTSLA